MSLGGSGLAGLGRLRSHILPAVGLLHVLLAIALPLRPVRAKLASEHGRVVRVLVVDVAVSFFFRRPAVSMILAHLLWTLPRPGMRLFMLSAGH